MTSAGPDHERDRAAAKAAAQQRPLTAHRERRTREGPLWAYIVIGVVLLITALVADQDSGRTAGTVVAGIALIAIGALTVARVLDVTTAAIIGFLGGLVLVVAAFTSNEIGAAQAVMLVAGAATFIGSFVLLAAARAATPRG